VPPLAWRAAGLGGRQPARARRRIGSTAGRRGASRKILERLNVKQAHRTAAVATSVFLGVAAITLAAGGIPPGPSGTAHAARSVRPNIIMVRTDDQTLAQFSKKTMPQTAKLVGGQGTTFKNFIVTTPLCCPSRAAVMTGQYGHNSGVLGNHPGYPDLQGKRNVLPVWLQRAGYQTAHVGKFLNGYGHGPEDVTDVAPGWDQWFTLIHGPRYYGYTLSKNGHEVHFGNRPRDHVTRVLDREALRLLRKDLKRKGPVYLQLDERAPHTSQGFTRGRCTKGTPQPDPRDIHRFSGAPLPDPPSFNEPDVSDKPSFIRDLPQISQSRIDNIRLRYQCGLASVRGVDRGMARIRDLLERTHELQRTVIIFTSDNGFFFGEHRLPGGKFPPYEESIRVPLLIRVPRAFRGGPRVAKVNKPTANIDLVPTILRLADARPCRSPGHCRTLDGRSLVNLMRGRDGNWPAHRGLLVELNDPTGVAGVCAYEGVRKRNDVFVRYTSLISQGGSQCTATGERERYDLSSDQFELQNQCFSGAPLSCPTDAKQTELDRAFRRLRNCSGIRGRDSLGRNHDYCE